jgi:hypothetical protein
MVEKVVDMEKNSKETREERFKRVATRRTNEILNRIRILGNCSNKSSYAYTDEEVNKIFVAIEKELRIEKSKFASTKKSRFSL